MTIIDRYLAGRFVAALFKTLAALVALFVIIDLLGDKRGDMLKLDIPWTVMLQYYLAFIPRIAYLMAPFSVLIAALLVFGESAQHNEITATLAAGVSLRRLILFPVLAALLFAVAIFASEQTVGAAATRKANAIEYGYFTRNALFNRNPISWANLSGDWTCHVMKFNRIAMTGENVLINSFRSDEIVRIAARRLYWDESDRQWMLEDGRWMTFTPDFNQKISDARITRQPAPFNEAPEILFAAATPSDQKTAATLKREIAQASLRGEPIGRLLVDYYTKYSHPALNFIMILLAIPFALRLRRGGVAISFAASIVVALAYLVVFGVVTELGYAGRVGPVTAAWLANGVFLIIGVVLLARTPT